MVSLASELENLVDVLSGCIVSARVFSVTQVSYFIRISIFIATTGELLKGGGIYVASQLTWYPGLALLGPEIVQKSKEIWNNFIQRLKNGFTQK